MDSTVEFKIEVEEIFLPQFVEDVKPTVYLMPTTQKEERQDPDIVYKVEPGLFEVPEAENKFEICEIKECLPEDNEPVSLIGEDLPLVSNACESENGGIMGVLAQEETLADVCPLSPDQDEEDGALLECDICQKTFKSKDTLRRHALRHTLPRTYECPICSKNFGKELWMTQHVTSSHNTEKQKLPCPKCDKVFSKFSNLRAHLLKHGDNSQSSDKVVQCCFCFKKPSLDKFKTNLYASTPSTDRASIKHHHKRLVERHFIEKIPPTEKKARPQKRCVVCYRKKRIRKETVYWCPDCTVALCLKDCFKIFHTQLEF